MTKRKEQIAKLRDMLSCHTLRTLRALETGTLDEELVAEAINLEIAARVAADLEADIIQRRRTSDELVAAFRRDKVGTDWPLDMNRQQRRASR